MYRYTNSVYYLLAAWKHCAARSELEGFRAMRHGPVKGQGRRPRPQKPRRICAPAPQLPKRPQPELQGIASRPVQPGHSEQR